LEFGGKNMEKKVVLLAFLATFILLGMGISSALNTTQEKEEKSKDLDKLDSPLFQIATMKAIKDPVEEKGVVYNFIIRFLDRFFNDRIFYTPLLLLLQRVYKRLRGLETDNGDPCHTDKYYTNDCYSCADTHCQTLCHTSCPRPKLCP
jgi:hypothetical protein